MALGGAGTGGAGKASASAIKAGEAFIEIHADDSKFVGTLKGIGNKLFSFGNRIQKIGATTAAASAAVLAPLTVLFKGGMDRAAHLDKLASKLGVTTEKLSQFVGAAEETGVSFDEMEGHWENWAERVHQGALGTGEAIKSFQTLGINAADLKLMDPIEQMIALSQAMQQVTNETERLGMLSSFGGDKFQWLNQLMKLGPEGIRKAMSEAPTVSSQHAKQATETNRAWARAIVAVQTALIPLIEHVGPVVSWMSRLAMANAEVARTVAIIAAGFLVGGAAFMAFGLIVKTLLVSIATLIGIGSSIVGAVLSPIGLAAIAIAGLTVLLLEFTETGQAVQAGFKATWADISETFHKTWGGMVAAMSKGDMATAANVAWTGLQLGWQQALLGLTKAWNVFKGLFVDGWHDIVAASTVVFHQFMAAIAIAFSAFLTGLAEGAAWLLEQVGADETASKLRGGIMSPESIRKERDAMIDAVIAERVKQQGISDAARKLSEAKTVEEIKRLQAELDRLLVIAHTPKVVEPVAPAPPPSASPSMVSARMANAVAGAFTSRDYKGILGVGPASSLAKDQLKTSKDQLKVLQKIEQKVGPAKFQ